MILTTKDMYQEFLDGIKKQSTAIVLPEHFNRVINDGQDEWIRQNAMLTELNQKQFDDLEKIRCVTDGVFQYVSPDPLVAALTLKVIRPDAGMVFSIPKYPTGTNYLVTLNCVPSGTQNYPRYLRLLNVMFKITYGTTNECGETAGTVSDWLEAKIMRSDQRTVILDHPYRQPKDSKLYYEIIGGKIRLITTTNSTAYGMRLEYFRYPHDVYFNKTNQADTGNTGTGSVNCEFAPQQRKEIVDVAVRMYLERVKDPRYQSYLQEQVISGQGK